MQVCCIEGLANHGGTESCAVIREGLGEASTGEHMGQPLNRESLSFRVPTRCPSRKAIRTGALFASARTTRRGRRTWHVWTLFVREPGDLGFGRRCTAGPCREGEEP